MIDDEEERKRRLEEARNIITGINNSSTNNSNNDIYNQRMQEANSIINSINPPKTRQITDEERQESINNANSILNLIEGNSSNNKLSSNNLTVETVASDDNEISKNSDIYKNVREKNNIIRSVSKSQDRDQRIINKQNSNDNTGIKIVDTVAENQFSNIQNMRQEAQNKDNIPAVDTVQVNEQLNISPEELNNIKYQAYGYDNTSTKISQNLKKGAENALIQIPYYMENEMIANSPQYAQNKERQYLASNMVSDEEKQSYISAAKNRLLNDER